MMEEKVIHLANSQIESFLKFISQEQAELNDQILELQRRYKDNENTIIQLKGNSVEGLNGHGSVQTIGSLNGTKTKTTESTLDSTITQYDSKSSWWEKVLFALKSRNKSTYARDILSYLYELDPQLKGDTAKERKNGVNLFALMSTKVRKGKLKRIRVKGEFVYGLPEWFNEDGRLKDIYR